MKLQYYVNKYAERSNKNGIKEIKEREEEKEQKLEYYNRQHPRYFATSK